MFHKPLFIFPWPETDSPIYPYKDNIDGGNSTIDAFEKAYDKVVFKYTLKKGISFPYTGINVDVRRNGTYLDISAYDSINLELETLNPTSVKILLRFYIDNYTQESNLWSYGNLEKELLLSPQKTKYRLPLNNFNIPTWWFGKVSILPPPDLEPDWKKIFNINLDTSKITHFERQESLIIRSISFQKPVTFLYVSVIVLCLLYGSAFALWFSRLKRKSNIPANEQIQGYRQTVLPNYKDEELGKLIDFLKMNYSDPDISIHTIYAQTGINLKKINQLIKNNELGSFKQLLNSLRIEEASRLLQTTGMKMLEIALTVGFSNIVHFNRVFRERTGMTPKEYRQKQKTKV